MSPAWKTLLEKQLKMNRSQVQSKWFTLATVAQGGTSPSARLVVFRGFYKDSNNLTIITDVRSTKVQELKQCPNVEVCWYLPVTRDQFRISGTMTMIGPQTSDNELKEHRTATWCNISSKARAQFMWPSPGEERTVDELLDELELGEGEEGRQPVDSFLIGVIQPSAVDHLSLKSNRRTKYLLEGDVWTELSVNP